MNSSSDLHDKLTPRQRLLYEALEITGKDRNKAYGNPEDNFRNIATLWTGLHTAKHGFVPAANFTPADVALFCICIKLARLSTNPGHRDSAVDIAGYAACLADIQETMQPQQEAKLDRFANHAEKGGQRPADTEQLMTKQRNELT